MGTQFLRDWSVSAGGITIGPGCDLRVVFACKSRTSQAPCNASIKLFNLAPDTAHTIAAAARAKAGDTGGTVTLQAGYKESIGIIFQGEVVQCSLGKDNATDTTCTIYAMSSDRAHNFSFANTTLKAGSTGKDVFDALMKTMPSISAGRIPTAALQAIRYPRAVTLFGMSRHHLHTLATTLDGVFHFDAIAPLLHFTARTDTGTGGNSSTAAGTAILLNSDTGLIGMPTQDATGINARCLMNPAIQVDSIIQINEKDIQRIVPSLTFEGEKDIFNPSARGDINSADGTYRVVYLEQVGDSRGDPWFCELNSISTSGHATTSQAGKGLGGTPGDTLPSLQ